MRQFSRGLCKFCKKETDVRLLDGPVRRFYNSVVPEEANKIIKICADCYVILAKKHRRSEASFVSSTVTSVSTYSTVKTSSTNTSSRSNENINSVNVSSNIITDVSYPESQPNPNVLSNLSSTNTSNAQISNLYNSKHRIKPGPLSKKLKRLERLEKKQREINEIPNSPTKNTNNRIKPGPLSRKRPRLEKEQEEIITDVISSDDDDLFDPGVRCPTIQPLIKKRRIPYEPRNFNDHDAPIFDTSIITGG